MPSSTRIFAASTDSSPGRPSTVSMRALGVLVVRLRPARDGARRPRRRRCRCCPRAARRRPGARQHDGAAHAVVVRLEPGALALAAERPRHALGAALDDGDHLALGAAGAPRADPDAHPVAVHRARPSASGGTKTSSPAARPSRLATKPKPRGCTVSRPSRSARRAGSPPFARAAELEPLPRARRERRLRGSGRRAGAGARGSRPRRRAAGERSRASAWARDSADRRSSTSARAGRRGGRVVMGQPEQFVRPSRGARGRVARRLL